MKKSTETHGDAPGRPRSVRIVVIGTSAGGLHALSHCLSRLPSTFRLPILVVQHLHPEGPGYLVDLLSKKCAVPVCEAADKETIRAGTVYVAPANYHLLVEDEGTLALSVHDKVNFARPSIDVLFESAADVFKDGVAGIVLTGANQDGAKGLECILQNGGIVAVQSPESAEYDAMPRAAIEATGTQRVLGLDEIAQFLIELDGAPNTGQGGTA